MTISVFFILSILCLIAIVSIAFNIAFESIKDDIIEEVLDRLEVEDDKR